MPKQEEFDFVEPKKEWPKFDKSAIARPPKVRVKAAGVIRDNFDTGKLMRWLDKVALKHHDSLPVLDVDDYDEFDEYGY